MLKKLSFTLLISIASVGVAEAKTVITCLTNSGHLLREHKPLVKEFNAMQDKIEVQYAAPAKNYADTHLRLMRESATNTLPDCAFEPYNQLPALARTLAKRHQILDLGTLIKAEGSDWKKKNYTDGMLRLGQVDNIQYGMPFNASVIQWYYNADLFKKAGLDPDHFPTTWDGLFAATKKLKKLKGITPMYMYLLGLDDWGFQTLIEMQGGAMVSSDGKKILFNENNDGVNAMKMARRLVTEGGMRIDQDRATQFNAFTQGKMAIYGFSPAGARDTAQRVGNHFDLRSAIFTVWNKKDGRLPAGGNAIVITTKDPKKIEAIWQYIKFMTSPHGQAVAAKLTGYMPTNKRTIEDKYLGLFYKQHPYYATPIKQYNRAGPWYGYAGTQTPEIWTEQRSVIYSVMDGKTKPEDAAKKLKTIAEKLSN